MSSPMIGAMSNVALWNHSAFVSAVEVLHKHDHGECMTRLCQARDKIQEMIAVLEGIGDAGPRANVPQGGNNDDPSDDGGGGPSQGPGSSSSKGNKGGNGAPGKHGNFDPTQGNNNAPTSSSKSKKGGPKVDENYLHSGNWKGGHKQKIGHPFNNLQLGLSTPKSHTNRKVSTMVKTPQTAPTPKTVGVQHKGSANRALSTSYAI